MRAEKPAFDVFVSDGKRQNSYWTKIGGAWPHEDGDGFNIQLNALPIGNQIILRKPKQEEPKT
jgi:hypothetical protein